MIHSRDGQECLVARDLVNTEGLACSVEDRSVSLFPSAEGRLVAVAVMPGWRRGWKQISNDGMVSDSIDSFFHFASQYVVRSRFASMMGALALVYRRATDFRGRRHAEIYSGDSAEPNTHAAAHNHVRTEFPPKRIPTSGARERYFREVVQLCNCLDPLIHRAVFQFIRSVDLFGKGFAEEGVAALDRVTDVAGQFMRANTMGASLSRSQIGAALGLDADDQHDLKRIYELRCEYGAHPAMSTWWDFEEIHEDDLDALPDVTRRLLVALFRFESRHRRVDPEPASWGDWFETHGRDIMHAVGFVRPR